jgi:hypothetical protein
MVTDADATPYQRLVGKTALAIEKSVKWSQSSDQIEAGTQDGKAASKAFAKEYAKINLKKAPADHLTGEAKFDPDAFRARVINVISLDLSPDAPTAKRSSQKRSTRTANRSQLDLPSATTSSLARLTPASYIEAVQDSFVESRRQVRAR